MSLTRLLQPSWLASGTLAELPLEPFRRQAIRALVLDVDRTLLPRRQAQLPAPVELWLQQAKAELHLHLFSNNPSRDRIGAVARQLGVSFTTAAGKPRRSALRRVLADLESEMLAAADELQFEKAATLRDQIEALRTGKPATPRRGKGRR